MDTSNPTATYRVLGVMSGTSLDGLDLAIVQLQVINGKWSYQLLKSESLIYTEEWKLKLQEAFMLDQISLKKLDFEFGSFIGQHIKTFINIDKKPDFIASHGHTIFHQPNLGITLQIGNAQAINSQTQIPVINNFRALDVSLGGQGAPLVPIGDKLLFHEYDYCLNLGGIANISYELENFRRAFDICPFNMCLNYLAAPLGLPFDDRGKLAQAGKLDVALLNELNNISFCDSLPPKSLGYEEFLKFWKPILDDSKISTQDKLNTIVEHSAIQISKCFHSGSHSVLITGGGSYNDYFISRLIKHSSVHVFVPNHDIIEFKEAIVFALLGALRFRNEPNCLSSVTGASKNNCGGELFGF